MAGEKGALDRAEEHRGTILGLVLSADRQGLHEQAWRLAATAYPLLELLGRLEDWERLSTAGPAAVLEFLRAVDDPDTEGVADELDGMTGS